jgi:hypothetical protein
MSRLVVLVAILLAAPAVLPLPRLIVSSGAGSEPRAVQLAPLALQAPLVGLRHRAVRRSGA